MSALSIRNMNFTLREIERIRWMQDEIITASIPHVDWYDWLIERPARRGNKKVTVCVLPRLTKQQFANWWVTYSKPGWTARVFFNPQKLSRMLNESKNQ